MPDQKISQLSDGGTSQATDEYVIARSGANYRIDGASIAAAATSVGTLSSLTVSGDLTVDTSTLKVDSANNRVGIGTASPSYKLDVDAGAINTIAQQWRGAGTNFTLRVKGNDASSASTSAYRLYLDFLDGTNTNGFIDFYRGTAGNDGFLTFGTTGTERMRLDASGNLGLGVTPSAWDASWKALQVGGSAALWGPASGANAVFVSNNTFFDGAYKYVNTGTASYYAQSLGSHQWHTAASGTAGNAITFTQAMTLDASGNVALGTTSASATLGRNITINGAFAGTNSGIVLQSNAIERGYVYASDTQMAAGSSTSIPLVLLTNGTERARIDSSGNLTVGATSPYNTSAISSYPGTARNGLGISVGSTVSGTYTGIYINRTASDGNYIVFDRDTTRIGTIDVAGTNLVITTNNAERVRIPAAGGMVVGTAAIATTATDGFLYVPTCAGTPTGTPTTQTGTAPIVVDTTNNKLYFYSGGSWRDAGP